MTIDEKLAAEGWIKHDGKEMPVDGDELVSVRLLGGAVSSLPKIARRYAWGEYAAAAITHYRIVPPNTDRSQVEALDKVADVPNTMTLLDQFAMAALTGLLAHGKHWENVEGKAYRIAKGMLTKRKEMK